MVVAQNIQTHRINVDADGRIHTSKKEKDDDNDGSNDKGRSYGAIRERGFSFDRNFFFDITEEGGLSDWATGQPRPGKRIFTVISNPYSNLLQFYFGGATSSAIMRGI